MFFKKGQHFLQAGKTSFNCCYFMSKPISCHSLSLKQEKELYFSTVVNVGGNLFSRECTPPPPPEPAAVINHLLPYHENSFFTK